MRGAWRWSVAAAALVCAAWVSGCDNPRADLRGDVVFTRRDGDNLALYRIQADGSGEELLYRHTGQANNNILYPELSEDKRKVYFTVTQGTAWQAMALDLQTRQVQPAPDQPPRIDARQTHAPDAIEIDQGSVYLKTPEGRKQLYFEKNYDGKFNTGASEARFSPDKRHVIFQRCPALRSCRILIAPVDGKDPVTLTQGQAPMWR